MLPALSLKDAPSLIERAIPVQKISWEAQKERKAVHGQTLTGLGSYWKGRKPLVLVKACVLGALLPASEDAEKDVEIFERLMAIDRTGFGRRIALSKSPKLKPAAVALSLLESGTPESSLADHFLVPAGATLAGAAEAGKLRWAQHVTFEERAEFYAHALRGLAFESWLELADRAEQVDQAKLYAPIWRSVNAHLKTQASSIPELVEQLGVARFGSRPIVGDAFCGSGSIPFEASRLGCEIVASDLNPIACMLTWAALNIAGADVQKREAVEVAQSEISEAVNADIAELGIEHNKNGDRAKAYLYCLEARCPQTGYAIPLLPSRIVSKLRKTIVSLVPDHEAKRFRAELEHGVSDQDLKAAEVGSVQDGDLVVELHGETYRTPIKTIRGDWKTANGESGNALRLWEQTDVAPKQDDIFQERLYAIQWVTRESVGTTSEKTYFASVSDEDEQTEARIKAIAQERIVAWQDQGLVTADAIETGKENEGPIRTNGWTHWHHMFPPRVLVEVASLLGKSRHASELWPFWLCRFLDNNSKSCRWAVGQSGGDGGAKSTFDSQALKTMFSWAIRAFPTVPWKLGLPKTGTVVSQGSVTPQSVQSWSQLAHVHITDPPYADAIRYEEITEFFIAWIRKCPPEIFQDWIWDSRRALAIKGTGAEFRAEMIAGYKNLASHMPDNGLQIVMFTHQDTAVWADMAAIMWGAGLQVTSAWYVATETTSELRKGGYVQGTILLVLRKLTAGRSGYADEIPLEIKQEVTRQIASLTGLNEASVSKGRSENLFEDADLQMAGYAAALRVLTAYTTIDGQDMGAYAARARIPGRKDVVEEMIQFAVDAANSELVPRDLRRDTWAVLGAAERFYLKMVDLEAVGLRKLDNYQNFAKAFRVGGDYGRLMASSEPNAARLKTSVDFGRANFDDEFGSSPTRAILWSMLNLQQDDADGKQVLEELRASVVNYFDRREDLKAIARYLAAHRDDAEAIAARTLAELIENERLG